MATPAETMPATATAADAKTPAAAKVPSRAARKRLGEEQLQRIISLCRDVEEKRVDPFLVDVDSIIQIVRQYFPEWNKPEELCLDAEAIHNIATVVRQQSEWVKHRSTSLYTDPFLLEDKINRLDRKQIATLFLKAWHPLVEMEQVSQQSLTEAVRYWQELLPLKDRWQKTGALEVETEQTSRSELVKQRILSEEAFSVTLESFWSELKQKTGTESRVRYWDFVGADTYEDTVNRAYLTSFLVTYGYATLEVYPLEEEIFIKPFDKPKPPKHAKQAVSVPVPVNYADWKKWREGYRD